MLLAGLTGNYGMGKSLALSFFGKLGAFTLDADLIVGEILKEEAVLVGIRRLLGNGVFGEDGGLIKERVSERIFRDESLRHALEDIIHPRVFERMDEILSAREEKVAVIEGTLIYERGYEGRFDKMIVVWTDEDAALGRLQASGISIEDARRRLYCQMPVEEKKKKADFVINNSGTPEETKRQVGLIYKELLKIAGD
jgi:dephospho-CoA kinase